MRARVPVLASLLLALTCGACTPPPPTEADGAGRSFLRALRDGDKPAIWGWLDRSLADSVPPGQLGALGDSLKLWASDSMRLIGWDVLISPEREAARVSYQLHGPHGWAVADVMVEGAAPRKRVTAFRITPQPASLADQNAFRLSGKTPLHLAMLFGAIAAATLSLGAAIVAWRARWPRRWLWVLVALIGVGKVGINWSTGQWFVQPLQFQFASAGFVKFGPVAPWMLSWSMPVGAVWVLWRWRRRRREQSVAGTTSSPAAA